VFHADTQTCRNTDSFKGLVALEIILDLPFGFPINNIISLRNTETQRRRDAETQRHRPTDAQTHRRTGPQKHIDTKIQRYRDAETQTHRHTDMQIHRNIDA
jgi:hypothetical protein